jgi:hypothetical protein
MCWSTHSNICFFIHSTPVRRKTRKIPTPRKNRWHNNHPNGNFIGITDSIIDFLKALENNNVVGSKTPPPDVERAVHIRN